jgi:hypothetical protein
MKRRMPQLGNAKSFYVQLDRQGGAATEVTHHRFG